MIKYGNEDTKIKRFTKEGYKMKKLFRYTYRNAYDVYQTEWIEQDPEEFKKTLVMPLFSIVKVEEYKND